MRGSLNGLNRSHLGPVPPPDRAATLGEVPLDAQEPGQRVTDRRNWHCTPFVVGVDGVQQRCPIPPVHETRALRRGLPTTVSRSGGPPEPGSPVAKPLFGRRSVPKHRNSEDREPKKLAPIELACRVPRDAPAGQGRLDGTGCQHRRAGRKRIIGVRVGEDFSTLKAGWCPFQGRRVPPAPPPVCRRVSMLAAAIGGAK